jgi:hypothetical protein
MFFAALPKIVYWTLFLAGRLTREFARRRTGRTG